MENTIAIIVKRLTKLKAERKHHIQERANCHLNENPAGSEAHQEVQNLIEPKIDILQDIFKEILEN